METEDYNSKDYTLYNSFLEAAADFITEQDEEWIAKEVDKTVDYLKAMEPSKTAKRNLPWKTSKDGDI